MCQCLPLLFTHPTSQCITTIPKWCGAFPYFGRPATTTCRLPATTLAHYCHPHLPTLPTHPTCTWQLAPLSLHGTWAGDSACWGNCWLQALHGWRGWVEMEMGIPILPMMSLYLPPNIPPHLPPANKRACLHAMTMPMGHCMALATCREFQVPCLVCAGKHLMPCCL